MEQYIKTLQNCTLFKNVSDENILLFLKCANYHVKNHSKGEVLVFAGFESTEIGILLSGKVNAQKQTQTGRKFTITTLTPSHIFGDVLASGHSVSPVTLTAEASCTVLYIPFASLLNKNVVDLQIYTVVLQNLISTISDKYFALNERIDLLLEKSLRKKVLEFLLRRKQRTGENTFTISFNRERLADYLGCERSALCRELSRLKNENIIEYSKNKFTII